VKHFHADRRFWCLLAPLALAGLSLCAARSVAQPSWAPGIAAAGLLAAGVLALVAIAARRSAGAIAVLTLLAAIVVVWMPSESPRWPALVSTLLAVAVAWVVAERLGAKTVLGLPSLLVLAAAAQWVVRGAPIWTARMDGTAMLELVVAPVVAALALAGVGRIGDATAVGALALAAFAAGPGWTPGALAALVAAGLIGAVRPRWLPFVAPLLVAVPAFGNEPPAVVLALALATFAALAVSNGVARVGRAALAVAAFAALLAGGPPWLRGDPVAALLRTALGNPFATSVVSPVGEPLSLSAEQPIFSATLGGRTIRAVVVDSLLSDSLGLPCGTEVARLSIETQGGQRFERALVVGRDSGEWAAWRPDVAPRLACPPPEPFARWLPAGGGFLAARYRTRIEVDSVTSPRRLVIERAPGLPRATGVTLLGVVEER